jgi:glycosyltransferase involved in cell wall biosynthesis
LTRNLSIIIPHYNKNEALQKTWKELLLQIHPDDEIIVVDDYSEVKPEFDCPCTRVIQPPKHTPHIYRLCTVRNYGIQHAKHDTVIILDPDCIPNPRFIDNARKMSDASILFTGCIDKIQKDGTIKPDGRRNSGQSYWCDLHDKGGSTVWGGCMMFSKSRTKLIGWFDEAYNDAWGAEEHDFASKCYHSGMRLRYSMELLVTHQYHTKVTDGSQRNVELWRDRQNKYREHLNIFTSYKPAVGVMVITMLRPELIDQCLRAIFRNRLQIKIRLVNNGDTGEDTRRICKEWGNRWAVDYIYHERKWPAQVRNDSLKWAQKNKFKYLVFIDDDATVINNGIHKLVDGMEKNPDVYAMSGKLHQQGQQTRLLGGPLRDNMFYRYTDRVGVHDSDWVGGGFTIHRIKPMLLYDDGYETGFNDYDWSMMAKRDGHRLAVTGDAEAWHAVGFTSKGIVRHKNSTEYNQIRYDKERHERMRKRFEDKWGFYLQGGGYTDN